MVDNRGPQLAGISATFGGIALITVLLRCFVRSRIVKLFGLDDVFMAIALLTYCWYTASVLGGIHYGTGRHMSKLTTDETMRALRYWWMCYVSYCATMTLAKISIGLFFLRVAVAKIHRYIIWTVMSVTAVTGVVFLFITLFQCAPVEFFWTKVIPGRTGTCINIDVIINLTYIYGSFCAICDFTFGILPIFVVWNLNIDCRTKLVLIPILGMACIASCAVIVRMPFIKEFRDPDFLYATVDIAIWSTTEAGLTITAGSLATIRPLYCRIFSQASTCERRETFGHRPNNNLQPGAGRNLRRAGILSICRYASKGQDDISFDFNFAGPNRSLYKHDEEDSNASRNETYSGIGSENGSQSIRTKDDCEIHIQNESHLSDDSSVEIHLTTMPSAHR